MNKLEGQNFRKLGNGLYSTEIAGEILQTQVSCSRRLSKHRKQKINSVFILFKLQSAQQCQTDKLLLERLCFRNSGFFNYRLFGKL